MQRQQPRMLRIRNRTLARHHWGEKGFGRSAVSRSWSSPDAEDLPRAVRTDSPVALDIRSDIPVASRRCTDPGTVPPRRRASLPRSSSCRRFSDRPGASGPASTGPWRSCTTPTARPALRRCSPTRRRGSCAWPPPPGSPPPGTLRPGSRPGRGDHGRVVASGQAGRRAPGSPEPLLRTVARDSRGGRRPEAGAQPRLGPALRRRQDGRSARSRASLSTGARFRPKDVLSQSGRLASRQAMHVDRLVERKRKASPRREPELRRELKGRYELKNHRPGTAGRWRSSTSRWRRRPERHDGPHTRRVGHRKGARRARPALQLPARREALRPRQLRRAPGEPHRVRAVRLRAGCLHRRAGAEEGGASSWLTRTLFLDEVGDLLSGDPGEAPPRPARSGSSSGWGCRADRRRRSAGRRHEPDLDAAMAKGRFARISLPPERLHDLRPAARDRRPDIPLLADISSRSTRPATARTSGASRRPPSTS